MTAKRRKMSAQLGFEGAGSKKKSRSMVPLGTKREEYAKLYCQHCGRRVKKLREYLVIQHIKGVPYRKLCKHCERLID